MSPEAVKHALTAVSSAAGMHLIHQVWAWLKANNGLLGAITVIVGIKTPAAAPQKISPVVPAAPPSTSNPS